MLDKALLVPHGGDRKSEDRIKIDNVQLDADPPTGNARAAALRRLRKDRPDLHERVIVGDLSPHAAMVEAGFRKPTITVPLKPEAAARALRRHFTPEQLDALIELLEATHSPS